MLEIVCKRNETEIKKVQMWHDRGRTVVSCLELRESKMKIGKLDWYPVHTQIFNKYQEARLVFMGLLSELAYENGNNEINTDRENIFIRGSLPVSSSRKYTI